MSQQFNAGPGGGRRVIVKGKLIEGEELRDYCDRNGLCPLCATVKVKEKKGSMFSLSWTDIPIRLMSRDGREDIEIYKGYHIAPTCYTMAQAKEALGESDEPSSGRKARSRRKKKSSSDLTDSDRSKDPQKSVKVLDSDPGPYMNPVKPPSETSDDVTHNSGGSSSLEQQASSSGNDLHVDSPRNSARISEPRNQSNLNLSSQRPFENRSTGTSSHHLRHRDGNVRAGSSGHLRTHSAENVARRNPYSSSDPIAGYRPTLSSGQTSSPSAGRLRSSHNVVHLPTIPSLDPVEAAIRDVTEEADRLDVYQFLIQLDCHRGKTEVLRKGLPLMRELVFEMHRTHPEKRYVFPNDCWCKTIKSAMSEHDHDANIQDEGAMTITFICSVSKKYKADLIRNHNSNEIIAAIEAHPSEEPCCIALECLTRTHGTNAEWREDHALSAFDVIKTVLSDPTNSGTSYAILALHNLTYHDNFRPEFVKDHVQVILSDTCVMETISALMQDDSVSEEVVEAIISLLQRFWVRFIEDGVETPISLSPDALLSALVGVMYIFGSETLHARILELLPRIPIPTSSEDLMWKQTLSDAILTSMTSNMTVESVQCAGLIALCNLFGDRSKREEYVVDLDRVVEVIVYAMNNYYQNADIQAQGCLALASICSSGDWYMETVISKEGITAIACAFRSHVVSVDPSEAPGMEDVKVAASTALATLARSSAAASVLRDCNLLLDYQTMLERDGLSPRQPSIRTCVINLLSASLVEKDDTADSGAYNFISNFVANFLVQDLDEMDAQALFMVLNAICSRSPNVIDTIISAGAGTGASRIVDLLEEFPENASIQEAGCALLSNIYFQVPFQGELNQSSHMSIESSSVHIQTHSAREINVISSALDKHKANVHVVKNACEALCNFVCGLNVVVTDPIDVHIPEDVASLFSCIPKEADSAMAIHEDNPEAMKSVLRLVLVAVRVISDEEMQRCSGNLIARIFETMLRLPHDEDIHLCACSILGSFVSTGNESILASTANAEGLRALLLSLQMENEKVVSFATGIISSLLCRVPTLINDVIEIEEYFGCLVECMYRFPDSVTIQAETCSILVSLATLSDPYVKTIIANSGGVDVVMLALRNHREQAYVLEYACKALAGLAEGIPDEILVSARQNICQELISVFNSSTNMEGVLWAAMEALCEFCGRDDYFDFQILESNAVPSIVDAMAQHINSGEVQQAGCKLVWLLSSKNDEYKRVLGQVGAIQALVTGLLAHITSTAIVKEALTALKHVSRISANKEALRQSEATDAIRLTIYANLDEPQVISAALSALNDIAVDTLTREVNRVTDETMNSVLRAMKTHPFDIEVQKIACWLLRSYTFNHSNLTLMRASRQDLFDLLLAASSRFPDECGERAQSILEKI